MLKSIQLFKRSTIALPGISSYKLEVETREPQNMTDKIFVKQRIRNFARGEIDDTFVAVCTPAQLEDFGEDSPFEGSSYYRTNKVELIGRTAEMLQEVFDSLVFEVKKLVVDLNDLEKLGTAEIFNISAVDPIDLLSQPPEIARIEGFDTFLRVILASSQPGAQAGAQAPPAPGVSYYQYSLNNGQSWSDALPRSDASTFHVYNLQNCVTYGVMVRAVSTLGKIGAASSVVHGSTISLPSAPIITAVQGGSRSLIISFTPPPASLSMPIVNYEVSVNNGVSWTRVAPAAVPSPITVTGLSPGISYDVLLRAVNSFGYGKASLAASGIPLS